MPTVAFSVLENELLAVYQGPTKSPNTLEKLKFVIKQMTRLGVQSSADLTTTFLANYISDRSQSVCNNTLRGELSYVRSICNYAVEEGYLDKAPNFRRLRPRESRPVRRKLFTITQIQMLLDRLEILAEDSWEGRRMHALAACIAYTGLRAKEALYLQKQDIDLGKGLIHVVSRQHNRLKTEASEAPVPIPPELADVLRQWLPLARSEWVFPGVKRRGPWTSGKYGKRPTEQLRLVAADLGITGLTLHNLRHTFATWARRRWGLTGLELRDVLRHVTEHTQEHYVHDDPDKTSLVKTVRKVSYFRDAS